MMQQTASMLVSSPREWVELPVSEQDITQAQALRRKRDALYNNLYGEQPCDERWVGDLGEIVLHHWMREEGVDKVRWLVQDAAGQPDFELDTGITVDAKTVKRKAPPRLNYSAQVSARHAGVQGQHASWFFFMTYCTERRQILLLGAIEAPRFQREATYYGPGEQVHAHYAVRLDHAIYNVGLRRLVAPYRWLAWQRY